VVGGDPGSLRERPGDGEQQQSGQQECEIADNVTERDEK
jgi:hypothetical protein